MRTWKDVATLVKPKNLNGRFVARPAAGLPFVLREGMHVAFVPPQTDLPREGRVDYARERGDGSYEVGFDTVGDESVAHALAGTHCLVRRSDLEGLQAADSPASWNGWQVVRADGSPIGSVAGFIDNPGQALIEVDRGEGLPAALIPVVDEFVTDVDEEQRVICVDVPEGLITINDGQ